jgi:hypothetical protein
MIENYDREERIAIRPDSHMSEARAIALTDAELQSVDGLAKRIAALAEHQSSRPQRFRIIKRADTATLAAGDIGMNQ